MSQESPSPLTVTDIPADCGNAPRKMVLRDFFVAVYSRDIEGAEEWLKDDASWEVVGDTTLQGLNEIRTRITHAPAPTELSLFRVLTHGTQCAVEGTITYADGTHTRFTHVLDFTGGAKTAKIKSIRSYEIS